MHDAWYHTLTRGEIDWQFYLDNDYFKRAVLADPDKYTGGATANIDTVAEIRRANEWVIDTLEEEEESTTDDDTDGSSSQATYKPLFKKEGSDYFEYTYDNAGNQTSRNQVNFSVRELMITGYTPAEREEINAVPDAPDAPTINIAPSNIQRPDNLPEQVGVTHS